MSRIDALIAGRPVTPPLPRLSIPALFVTGTDTDVGKTLVAGAIADWFRRRGARVAVLKPAATGCVHRREGLVSEDAEFLAACADARFPLDLVCPQRFVEPLAPGVAAERAKQPMDWSAVARSIRLMEPEADVMIVEGAGGVMVPMDDRHTVLDVIGWLGAPAVVVARPNLGTINHSVLTVNALRSAGAEVAGVVVNRYRPDGATVAEETNPRLIEKWGKVPLLAIVPETKHVGPPLPADVVAAVEPVDWARFARVTRGDE
ncbi:MAG TPA: dethiobiotin synthase [Humisphaera sp.]